jgi:hypothetical protein
MQPCKVVWIGTVVLIQEGYIYTIDIILVVLVMIVLVVVVILHSVHGNHHIEKAQGKNHRRSHREDICVIAGPVMGILPWTKATTKRQHQHGYMCCLWVGSLSLLPPLLGTSAQ